MPSRFASRHSLQFKRRHTLRIGLRHLGTRLAVPETHLPEQTLTLPYPQLHAIVTPQVLGQQFAVPQVGLQAEVIRAAAQIPLQRRPLGRCERARTSAPFAVTQPVEPALLNGYRRCSRAWRIIDAAEGIFSVSNTSTSKLQSVCTRFGTNFHADASCTVNPS